MQSASTFPNLFVVNIYVDLAILRTKKIAVANSSATAILSKIIMANYFIVTLNVFASRSPIICNR
jgi:hypothetical protein